MCRIAGIISKHHTPEQLSVAVKAMAEIQAHGGPDDAGYFVAPELNLALSHRRLSLVDLSPAGHQPMFIADGRYGITFNGEIYNFPELKQELIALGCRFKSSSDTEVILYAFQQWGTESFAKFKGMFAFALLDQVRKQLYLVRDAQGIKPLYYYQQADTLIFASEVKAFNEAPVRFETQPHWPEIFLACGHLPEPLTTLQNVLMLPKGHFLQWSMEHGGSKITSFKPEKTGKIEVNSTEAQQLLDSALDQAIQSQLLADAPIGVFLSGGIDSSLLALQAAKYQEEKLLTVSLHFPEAKYSEKKYQELVSKKLPGKHLAYEITSADFERDLETILQGMDQPSTDGINSWFVSKAAHEAGLTAVLSGIGADELFGGYPSFKRMNKFPFARKWRWPLSVAAQLTGKDALKRVNYLSHQNNSIYEYLFLRGLFNTTQIKQLTGQTQEAQFKALDALAEPGMAKPATYDGKRAAWYEQHYFMQNQLLKDADFMSMQHGLEIRVPFLDPDVVALADQLPAGIVFDPTQPAKHLLIHAFNNLLPEAVWNRPKMGFTFPFQQWLTTHPLYFELKETYSGNAFAKNLFHQFEKGQVHWSKVMSLMVMRRFNANV